ncbi:ATG8-interacting protein 1-like isoform X1 [Canna indica]|uniref:ATG8-interacting protein 1-like isoform X1 n=1 Tax=Canna indica TaxID=4628 RepID=A0AAQ3K345_9LILI|nr:ATG8-interacting protein 1-like isoform X1 [Canna indica]
MADNEKGEEGTSSRGVDWEVVSLTASTYAAAPGPQTIDTSDKSDQMENITEHVSSDSLFMSGHFVFPPSEHENLPIETDMGEIHGEVEGDDGAGVVDDDNGIVNSGKEKLQTESKDDQRGVEFFDGGSRLSTQDVGFEEKASQMLTLVEHGIFADPDPVVIHSETHQDTYESEEPLDVNTTSPKDHSKIYGDGPDGSGLPCQAWWKRHAVSLYRQAKEANTFWSVAVTAAVLGIIVFWQRWQREKWQLHQSRWRFSISDERMSRMLKPLGRFKDVLVGGQQPSKPIR